MYTCQSGQQPPQVGNPSQYVTRSPMDGTQNTPQYRQVRADPNQPPPYMQVRADVSQPQNVQFTSHNGVYYNGQTSNDQALRNPQHGPTAARINTTMQTTILTQTANAQSRSHSLPNRLNCQPDHTTIGLLKKLLERDTPPNYWPQQSPNGGIQPNVTNSLQSCASTPDQHVTIYNNQTVVTNYPATGYMAQQLNNAQTNLGQNVNGMARQPQSQNSTVNTFIQDAQKLCNGTLESGVAYNQQPALHHSRGYRRNGTQHGSSPHVALSSQMPSAQSFTNNNYAQMANSSNVSSNQMPSHQSFTSNNYAQMANSSNVSSNQMPSPQSYTINAYVRMENSSGAPSSQMPSPQSFTSNGYTQITNSLGASSNRMSSSTFFPSNTCVQMANSAGASSSQMPSPQSFSSNTCVQMTNSSGASSNRMSSSQSFPSTTCVQMANSAGASSSQMPSPQSFSSNTCVQMTNSSGASSNRMSSSQSFPSTTCVQMANSAGASSSQMPSPQSFSSNTCVQMANSAGASSSPMPSPQSFTSNGYTQMANSAGASSSQMPSPQSFTSNSSYAQMTNSLGAPSQPSSPQSFTSNSYVQMANSSTSSGAFLPKTSMTPQTQHSGRDNSVSSQAFIYPNGSQYHNHLSYSKKNSTNVVMSNSGKADSICQNPTGATQHHFPVKNTFHPGNTVKSIVKDNNAKCAPTVQSEGYSISKRLSFNKNGSQSSKQPTSEASHASAPVQKGFYVTVTEDKTGFKADNVIFLGNKVDTSRFTKESVQGSSSNYAQLEQLPGKISQQRNDKQPPLQSNAKLPETVGSTVKLVEQRAVAVVQPLSQTINQVFSMQEHSQMSHGQCKNGTIKQMGGNLEKSCISPQHDDDSRVCLAVSSDGTKVSLIEDTGPNMVGTDMTSTKLSVAEDTQHEDVVNDSHWEVTPTPQLSVTTEVSVSQTGENNSEMQEDSDAMDLELSLVPTIPWTFDKLMTFIETTKLKCKQMQSEDLPVIDLSRKIMCLFWEGRIDKLKSELKTDNYLTLMADVTTFINRITSDSVIVSQVDCSWDKIKDGYQVLNDDYVPPKVTYTSSWLNTNEQLDDIDKDFGFPQSLKYCPDELESDNQSKLGSDDEMDETEDSGVKDIITENGISVDVETTTDSNDLCSLLEIHVMPPDEAKIVFEQVHNYQAKSEKPADQSEKFSDSVVNDGKADSKKPEEKVEPDMQEFCCVIRCIAAISGKPITKCQCKQKQDSKSLIMNTENTERREKLAEQCTEVGEIICLSDDDDEMHLSLFSAEPKSISLPSTSSMADSCNSSMIEIETEIETSVLTSEAEGHCGQAEKNAKDQRRMSLGMEERPTPTGIHLRESSDAKLSLGVKNEKVGYHEYLFLSQSPDPNNISLVAKPNTCKRTVGLEEDDTDLWEILGEQCTDIMETIDLTNYDDEMSFSNSEPGSISLPSTSSIGHSCSSSIIEKGTKILSSTNEVETTVLTTNEVETTVLTSEVEDNCGQAEQNPTDMTSEVEDNCGQAEQNPTDMTSDVEDNCGQAEQNPTDMTSEVEDNCGQAEQNPTDITSEVEDNCGQAEQNTTDMTSEVEDNCGQAEQNPTDMTSEVENNCGQAEQNPTDRGHISSICQSNKSSDAKVCFLNSLSLGQSHVRDPKKNLSLDGRPNKRKRTMGLDAMSTFQKKMKRCKQSSLSTKLPTIPLGKPKHVDKLSIQENIMDFEYVTNVIPVKLALFGSNNGKRVINGRGINRDNCFSDHGIPPPQIITVYIKTRSRITPVVEVPVKPQIFEDPHESQAIMRLQNLSVITDTGKKCTLVVKSPVKQIFEDPSEAILPLQNLSVITDTGKKCTLVVKSPVKQIFEDPSESQAIMPLQNLSVDTNTGKKHTLVVKRPVKQIFEDPSESRASTLPQILTADSNTWKKSTAVLKSPVKRHIFEGPLESSPTSVKQRIHNEWKKTVVPTSGKYKKRRLTPGNYMVTCSLSERSPKKPESVQPTNAVNHPVCSERRLSRLLSRGTEKKKQSLRLDIRKSILHGYKHKKNKSKESPVKCNKPSDGMGSTSEGRNHAFMPKEKKIILKFSVLPSTFNFKDGSTGTDSLDTPDLVKAQDRISKTDVKGPRGDWALVPSKKYCPLPSTSSTVPKETTTFHQFQKKYLEAKQPSGDE